MDLRFAEQVQWVNLAPLRGGLYKRRPPFRMEKIMIIINKQMELVDRLLGAQKTGNVDYRHFKYIKLVDIDYGLLLYNLLTRELIFLNRQEKEDFYKKNFEKPFMQELISKWFFVPTENEDYSLFKKIDDLGRQMTNSHITGKLEQALIFTTTDCNARCFYCFEKDSQIKTMSTKTANDVAKFLISKYNGKHLHVKWFGGEPLLNLDAINIICGILKKEGIAFSSGIATNAYLFDESIIKTAKDSWKLRDAQITLDGTETVYNKVKAYIHKGSISPFKKVIDNIEKLLNCGIYVNIRLNIDMHNYKDIEKLVDYLIDRFARYNKCCKVYFSMLYDNIGKTVAERTEDIRVLLYDVIKKQKTKLGEHDMNFERTLKPFRRFNFCAADSNFATVILPDGKLSKCEHYFDDKYYGDIYSNTFNFDNYNYFKIYDTYGEQCKECALQPRCIFLKACNHNKRFCDEIEKENRIAAVEKQMKNEYLLWKTKNPKTDF